jgi:hypothetical protein
MYTQPPNTCNVWLLVALLFVLLGLWGCAPNHPTYVKRAPQDETKYVNGFFNSPTVFVDSSGTCWVSLRTVLPNRSSIYIDLADEVCADVSAYYAVTRGQQ